MKRPLGHSLLLWGIGTDGADGRTLQCHLGLASGHLGRGRRLRSLKDARLIMIATDCEDRRVRVVRPEAAGIRERVDLDGRSDDAAAAVVAALND